MAEHPPNLMKKSQSTPAFDLHPRASPSEVRINVRKALNTSSMPLTGMSESPLSKPQPPAIISFKGLVVSLRSIKKILINDVSGQITTGYWAIMG